MKLNKLEKAEGGFTLLEVIVSLVLAGILGTILVAFLGTGMMKSAQPVIIAKNGVYLNSIMENMSADYRYLMANAAKNYSTPESAMTTFVSRVGSEGTSQTYYSKDGLSYTVVNNHPISFTTSSPVTEVSAGSSATAGQVIKVSINYNNLTATALFTE